MTAQVPEPYEPTFDPETDIPVVPVKIGDPVGVRQLPAIAWTITRYGLSDATGPTKAMSRNPYRKRALIIPETAGVLVGSSNEQVRTRETAGLIPLTVMLELTHTEEIWINNVAGETPKATVIEETWPS
jgi:hypothetical protein